jgi:adenylate cyclase
MEKESDISPGTVPPPLPPKDPAHKPRKISNWDGPQANDFRDYRKQLAVLETSGGRVPSISRNPPTATSPATPWTGTTNGSVMPSSVFGGSFFNESTEDLQLSPGFRPGSGKEDSMGFPHDDRRPSVASNATVSSSGSHKSSISRYHKKLQGFFGDEYPGDTRQNSDTSLATPYAETQSARSTRNRNNSVNNTLGSSMNSRPGSPVGSRPRTPLPSSEVTPWEFQEFNKVSLVLICLRSTGWKELQSCLWNH